jgi:hypothetical protein
LSCYGFIDSAFSSTATRNFADPDFEGDPAFASQEEIDEYGQTLHETVVTPEEPDEGDGQDGTVVSPDGGGPLIEIMQTFGGADRLRQAVEELQALLYAA